MSDTFFKCRECHSNDIKPVNEGDDNTEYECRDCGSRDIRIDIVEYGLED